MKQTILAIEGGGSGFRAIEVTGRHPSSNYSVLVLDPTPDNLVEFICQNAERVKARAIGISISGFVTEGGTITHSTNTGLPDGLRLAELVAKASGLPTKVVNDLVAATRGISSIIPDIPRFLVENLGDGDGQNEFDNGRIKPVDERGHMTIDLSPFALPCACGLYGCVESILGGSSLKRRVLWTIDALRLPKPKDMHPCALLDQEYVANAPWAVRIYDLFALTLGVKLANMQLSGKFPCIVFRGTTITKALRLPKMKEKIHLNMRLALPDQSWADVEFRVVPERPDMPKDYDAILGAAAFAQDLLNAK